MTRKIYASLLALIIALTAIVLTGKQSERAATAAPAAGHELLSQLPASDFILYADAQRMLTEIVPNILSDRPEARARFEADMDRFQKETGFDLRTLDTVAVGFNFNDSQRARDYDFAFVARGRFDAQATIEAGFNSATKHSEGRIEKQAQQYEGRAIYLAGNGERKVVITVAPPTDESGAQVITPKPVPGDDEPRPATTHDRSMAFVALDSNTIAFGNLKSVRATIDASMGRERVSDELVQLATRTPNAVAGFSGTITPEMARSLRIGPNKAQDSIASIRQVYGSFNINGNNAEAYVNLRTETPEQARQLSSMAKLAAALGRQHASSRSGSLEALIKDLSIEAVGNEVQMSVKFAQADLAPFIQRL
jgi:hypothetical protein